MNKGTLIGALAILIIGALGWLVAGQNSNEFHVGAEMFPASPAKLALGDRVDIEIAVRDSIDEPDETPWTMCGIIAGPPSGSSADLFPHDSFGYLDPFASEVEIIQDEDDSLFFPQGGTAGDVRSFRCVDAGTDQVYMHYITSRLVNDCTPENLIIMQNDPNAENKSLHLGNVECIDPTAPPKKAGREVSPGAGDGIKEEENGVPEGFEYVGGQTIEIGADGEFIDHGYLDRGNPPEGFQP